MGLSHFQKIDSSFTVTNSNDHQSRILQNREMSNTMALPCFGTAIAFASAARRPTQRAKKKKLETNQSGGVNTRLGFSAEKKEVSWKCVQGCGACCKLDKGPAFASPEEIFENPQDVEHYRSLIGPDGWCRHYEKTTRQCSIYSDRPYFCRVEPEIFETLYGINEKKFNKEACSCCTDTIKAIYGSNSKELDKFNQAIRRSDSVQ